MDRSESHVYQTTMDIGKISHSTVRHIQHTYSEIGSDTEIQIFMGVYCCPNVVLTLSTTLIHTTEQVHNWITRPLHKQKRYNYMCVCIEL